MAFGLIGGGLAIGFRIVSPSVIPLPRRNALEEIEVFNWVLIAPDNTVTIRISQPEMGQGAMTSIAQFLAEELGVDWSKLKTEFISTATHLKRGKVYGLTESAASLGVKGSELLLRTCGAQIKAMFVKAGARRMRAPEREIAASNSCVIHKPTGRKMTYAELAADAARMAVPDPLSVALKHPSEWTCIGKSVARIDIPSKTDGTAIFGIDVDLPGMKHAAIAMSPVFRGKLKSYDVDATLSQPGVHKVVEIKGGDEGFVSDMGDAIAVVADSWWQARKAVDAMAPIWDGGDWATTDTASIIANLRDGLGGPPETILRDDGHVEKALLSPAQTIQSDYFVPYLNHATMEPMNCTALVTERGFEVWAPTQCPEEAIEVAANIAGMPVDSGELHVTLMGGGFGRRQYHDFVSQAVQIATAMKGTPVKLLWSREDTMQHGFFRPASCSRLRGALDAAGNLEAWWHRVVAHSDSVVRSTLGADSLLYGIPSIRIDRVVRQSHVPEGAMRGVAFATNCFVTQSFMDELARAAGKDTYAFQRALLSPDITPANVPKGQLRDDIPPSVRAERLRAVLDACADKAHWGQPLGENRGRGIAVHEEASAFYAVAVEVTLDGDGWFGIDRVVVAGDPGFLVNPGNAGAQVEGSVAFALSAAIYGEINLRQGRVSESNFHDYQVLRMHEMPKVETHWVLNRQFWGGVGEPVVAAVIPALTNAIYDAGGPRIRSLPLKNHRILKRIGDQRAAE